MKDDILNRLHQPLGVITVGLRPLFVSVRHLV